MVSCVLVKDGMTRRTFLKLLGGMAVEASVYGGKFFKLAKEKNYKEVPMIGTDNVTGKPEMV